MAFLKYDKLYRKLGLRRLSHFVAPRIMKAENFRFPTNSTLYYFKSVNNLEYLNRNLGILNNKENNLIVNTIFDYNLQENQRVGSFRQLNTPTNIQLISQLVKQDKSIRFLRPGQVLRLTPKTTLIKNYSLLNKKYHYPEQLLRKLFIFKNSLNTLINDINTDDSDRNIFINIDLPTKLLTRPFYNIYSLRLSNGNLKNLPTYKDLLFLDLWCLLDIKTRNRSSFSELKLNKLNNITLLLNIDNKVTLVNLGGLLSFIKEYNSMLNEVMNVKLADTQPSIKIRLLFYHMIYELIKLKDNINITENFIDIEDDDENELDAEGIDLLYNILNTDKLEKEDSQEENDILDNKEDINNAELIEEENTEIEDIEDDDTIFNIEEEIKTNYNTLEDVIKEDISSNELLTKQINYLKENKILNNKQKDKLLNTIEEFKNKKSILPNHKTMNDILNYQPEYTIDSENNITDIPVVLDKSYNKNTNKLLTAAYVNKKYKEDIIKSIYNIQYNNLIISDIEVTSNESILGTMDTYNISMLDINAKPVNVSFKLPRIEEDGTFITQGNRYIMRKARQDIVIRKIDNTTIVLSSSYGKMFINKASYKKEDIGYKIYLKINKLREQGMITNLIALPSVLKDVKVPLHYSWLARYTSGFIYLNINSQYSGMRIYLNYNNRQALLNEDIDLKKLEDNKYILIGVDNNHKPLLMDMDNKLYLYDKNKYTEINNIFEILEIDINSLPIEYASIKIYKKIIPLVILLSYYLGFNSLLKATKVNYRLENDNLRVSPNKTEYYIRFKDKTLYIERDNGMGDIILGGLVNIDFRNVNYNTLNNRNQYGIIYNRLELNTLYSNEIKLLENLFVDPLTKEQCDYLGFPNTFKGLLIKSCEMLLDDNYVNPNNVNSMFIRGYDRIVMMLYKELITSIKDRENKSVFSKQKLTLDPNAVMARIKEDSSVVLADDLNPMALIKQQEDTTFLGSGGRQKVSMSLDTREVHESEIGLTSEATKDSGDVGITSFLTANPKLDNILGTIGDKEVSEWSEKVSTSALLSPFGLMDDPKRLNFASIMNSHIIPIKDMRVPYIRTGYESIIPLKSDSKFIISAKEDGKVLSVTDKEVIVQYKTLGKESYKLKQWTTKANAGYCYTHTLVSNVLKSETFLKDDTLVYDILFFEPDIFYPKRVIYKQGTLLNVALMEDSSTYEDSASMSIKVSDRLSTNTAKIISKVIDCKDNVIDLIQENTDVLPDTPLFSILNSYIDSNLDEKTKEILKSLNTKTPKAKIKGKVSKIELRYNCELEDLSTSLLNYVNESDIKLKENTGYTGRVTSAYNINGVPLLENQVEIKIYIITYNDMGIGDKAILGNQCKFTIGEVYEHSIKAEDGTDIELIFSYKSISARIVNSPMLIGTTSMILEQLTKKAIDTYFK